MIKNHQFLILKLEKKEYKRVWNLYITILQQWEAISLEVSPPTLVQGLDTAITAEILSGAYMKHFDSSWINVE